MGKIRVFETANLPLKWCGVHVAICFRLIFWLFPVWLLRTQRTKKVKKVAKFIQAAAAALKLLGS